jgi:DNA-binding protein
MPVNKRKKETAQKQKPSEEQTKAVESTEISEKAVLIGKKPVMSYVVACLTHLSSGSNKVTIKARGRAICRAVDTAEVLRRSFAKNLEVQGISLCTEEVTREAGRKSNVSAIEITLTKS